MAGGGFGGGPWGGGPWGGALYIPATIENFDIFCFEDATMFTILSDPNVSTVGNGSQFNPNAGTLDLEICSGGAFLDDDARLIVTTSVPQSFTVEWIVDFANLPNDFTDLINQHIYLGCTDAAGPLVGFFFSKVGIAYTGSVSFSGTGDIQLDTSFQVIPGSAVYVSEGEYWVIRAAADLNVGVVYFYVTKQSDLASTGHQLRAILPVIPYTAAASPPTDRSLVSVHGTALNQVCAFLDKFCLGSALIIPNLAPVANAGADQAARTCSIIQLDGSQSFDPEGASLTYQWRLIEAPLTSVFGISREDGRTYPLATPTGFTDKFHSTELGVVDAADPLDVGVGGDVLRIDGDVYTIAGTGIDGNGFYVQLGAAVLSDSLSGQYFRVLRQRGISGGTTVNPTFYPDVPGFYSFDLIVFDGGLSSAASATIVNVLESPLPRGCTPDLAFIFDYLSDFWKLVEGRDRISVFWGALAQVAATELFTLWQTEYSKSLRDIQRVFVRRWLHYDLLLGEPLPELTTIRPLFGGVTSAFFSTGGVGGIQGTVFEVESGVLAATVSFPLSVAAPTTPTLLAAHLQERLRALADSRFTAQVVEDRVSGDEAVRIDAPFPFTIGSNTTTTQFTVGAEGRPPTGTTGAAVGNRTYKVERSLEGLGIQEDDFLVLDGVAYRIVRVIDNAGDTYPYQRVVVKEELPVAPTGTWDLTGWVQSELLDFYGGLVDQGDYVDFEVSEVSQENAPTVATHSEVETLALGVNETQSSRLAVDQWSIGAAVADDTLNVYLARVNRRRYVPVDELVQDIPTLQQFIVLEDDETTLRRNLDFFIEEVRGHNAIRFSVGLGTDLGDVWEAVRPPNRLWAEYTYIDNNPLIEDNFGLAVEFTVDQLEQLPSNVDYLSAVRGLFYAFYNGPTLYNLRVGVQILLGLPFVEEPGTIEEIRTDFSSNNGRILIRDTANTEIVRSYSFPRDLALETNPATGATYAVGDVVEQFAPLVEGTDIIDWITDPTWFEGMLSQGIFFEVEKFHQFVVQVDEAAFNLAALLFVQNFILKIKPTYTFPRFIVRKEISETEISVTDDVEYTGTLYLNDSVCAPLLGVSWMYDQPRPAGGGWRNQYDGDEDPSTTPTFPTPESPVRWGFDKTWLCPNDEVTAYYSETFSTSFTPKFDSAFAYGDSPQERMTFFSQSVFEVAAPSTGTYIGHGDTIVVDGDMETAGVGAYFAAASAVLTKVSVDPYEGLQNLDVAYGGAPNPFARQTLFAAGKNYYIRGWTRSDGSNAARVWAAGNLIEHNTSTSWTFFEGTFTYNTNAFLSLYCLCSSAASAEFDKIEVYELPDTDFGRPATLITDGDMETAGVAEWPVWNSATITKETTSPQYGLQNLKVARNGVNNPGARKVGIFSVSKTYRVRGWVRSDGYSTAEVWASGVAVFSTTSTSWVLCDVTVPYSGSSTLVLFALTSTGTEYAEFDAFEVYELVINDGDMEATGTAAWTAGNSATLTKDTTTPFAGAQNLRVARNGVNNPSASQFGVITPGTTYHLHGWVRSDGFAAANVYFGGSLVFTTALTTWQEVDLTLVAGGTNLNFTAVTSTGTEYAEYDHFEINELPYTNLIDLKEVNIWFQGDAGLDPTDYLVEVDVDGVNEVSEAFTARVNGEDRIILSPPVAVTAGKPVSVRIVPASGAVPRNPDWSLVVVRVVQEDSVGWVYDGVMTPGTYFLEKTL